MGTGSIILFWIAFCGLVMASVVYVQHIVKRSRASVPIARMLSALSWLLLTVSIYHSSRYHGGTPLTGPNQLVLLAWALVLAYFLLEYLLKFRRYGAVLIPVAAILLFVAQLIPSSRGNLAPYVETISAQMDSAMISFHVLLIVIANALLLIGCITAALYLYQDWALKNQKNTKVSRALPALANIKKLWVRVLSIGLPIYFAGQLLGVTRAIVVDAQGWYFDIRIILSGAVLIVFSVALFLYYRGRTATVTSARLAFVGALLIIMLMIAARVLPVGFHIFGVL